MKTTNARWWIAGAGLWGLALLLGPAGCESTDTADTAVLVVTPAEVTLTNGVPTAVFTASYNSTNAVVALPLNWSVSDPSLGSIKTAAGMTAIYESTGKVGNNSVIVTDQGSASGVAVVNQF